MTTSYIALGYECNHNCICCPLTTFDRLHAPLQEDLLEKQINEICKGLVSTDNTVSLNKQKYVDKSYNKIHVVISGGEPTLNKNFLRVLKLLSLNNAHITVLSNSSSCENISFVNQLLEALSVNSSLSKFRYVTAIHSCDPVLHDKITNTPGSLWQTMTGLDNLVYAGVNITIKHILNKMTCESMPETFDYLDNHFPPSVEFQFCGMDYCGRCSKNIDDLFVSFDKLQPYLEKTLDLLENRNSMRESNGTQHRRRLSVFEAPLCMTDPYYWKYYNTPSENLTYYIAPNEEGDGNKSANVSSNCGAYYKPCKICDVRNWCQGTWRSAHKIGGDILLRPIKTI